MKGSRVIAILTVLSLIVATFVGITTGIVNVRNLLGTGVGNAATSVLTVVNTFSTTQSYLQTVTTSYTTSYTATFSTTSITTSTALSTSVITSTYRPEVPINPDLKIRVIPQYGWNVGNNGELLAIVPKNESATFSFVFENQGSVPLDVLCCSVNIQYLPSSLHDNSGLSGGSETIVAAQMNATYPWTYPTSFPHFPGYQAQITFIFFSADGSWENPMVVPIYFSS